MTKSRSSTGRQSKFHQWGFWICVGLSLIGLVVASLFWLTFGYTMAMTCLGSALGCGLVALFIKLDERARRRMGQLPPLTRW